jgi:hypothetical protein
MRSSDDIISSQSNLHMDRRPNENGGNRGVRKITPKAIRGVSFADLVTCLQGQNIISKVTSREVWSDDGGTRLSTRVTQGPWQGLVVVFFVTTNTTLFQGTPQLAVAASVILRRHLGLDMEELHISEDDAPPLPPPTPAAPGIGTPITIADPIYNSAQQRPTGGRIAHAWQNTQR